MASGGLAATGRIHHAREPMSSSGRVLVTGGAGFIGRHVVRALLTAGRDVVVVDREPHPDPDVPAMVGDLRDAELLDRLPPDIDAVVHLVALTSVLVSVDHPAEAYDTNVALTARLLEYARSHDVSTLVMASTNAVVGNVGTQVITEGTPLTPLTPYGATKAAAEMLLWGYAGSYGLRTVSLRLSNVYGPGMHRKDSFVPRLMRAAAGGGSVQVYGDGLQRRDLVHVYDVARAFALAVEGWPTGRVIIGGGTSYRVLDLVAAAREVTGCPIPVEHVPPKHGEMPAVIVDITRSALLGWTPEVGLLDGLRTVWTDLGASKAGLAALFG